MPQYNPQVVFVQPDPSAMAAASLITLGAGIAPGASMADASRPWGWGGWGWNWGRRTVIGHNNVWVANNRYRPRYPSYRFRPPVFNRPVYVRPPNYPVEYGASGVMSFLASRRGKVLERDLGSSTAETAEAIKTLRSRS